MSDAGDGAAPVPGAPQSDTTPFDLFILALSFLSLLNLILLLTPISNTTKGVLLVVDTASCIPFLIDFGLRLQRAPNRRRYFLHDYGWLDLLGSLPFPGFRIVRVVRVIRGSEAIRKRGARRLWLDLTRERASAALLFVLFMVIVTIEAGAVAVLWAERPAPTANIRNASDAIWWALATITTIGYGDKYPVTNAGRLVGTFLMVVGVGLFGTFTAFVANAFVHPGRRLVPRAQRGTTVDEIHALLNYQEDVATQLRDRVAALEAQLEEARRARPTP